MYLCVLCDTVCTNISLNIALRLAFVIDTDFVLSEVRFE